MDTGLTRTSESNYQESVTWKKNVVNKRSIGISSTMDGIRPCDIIPVYSRLDTKLNMAGCSEIMEKAAQEFRENWESLYKTSI